MKNVAKPNNSLNWHIDHYVPIYGWEDTGISTNLPDWIALELLATKYGPVKQVAC